MPKSHEKVWLDNCIKEGARGFFATSTTITPELATEIMARNPRNRSILGNRVDLYAADIAEGRWSFNGEAIIISSDGRVTDGQHRLAAIIKAGVPIVSAIAFGVDFETRKTTDQGRPKTAGDYAAMDGIPNAQGVAAIAKAAVAYETYGDIQNSRKISQALILQYIEDNRDRLCASASFAHSRQHRTRAIVAPSVIGFCHYVTSRICPEAAEAYFDQIITGAGLATNDPAMVVRNRLIQMGKASRAAKAEIILHGWNAFRRGQLRTLVRASGKIPELI